MTPLLPLFISLLLPFSTSQLSLSPLLSLLLFLLLLLGPRTSSLRHQSDARVLRGKMHRVCVVRTRLNDKYFPQSKSQEGEKTSRPEQTEGKEEDMEGKKTYKKYGKYDWA